MCGTKQKNKKKQLFLRAGYCKILKWKVNLSLTHAVKIQSGIKMLIPKGILKSAFPTSSSYLEITCSELLLPFWNIWFLIFPLNPSPSYSNSLIWPLSVHFPPTASALAQPPSLSHAEQWKPSAGLPASSRRASPVHPATGCWRSFGNIDLTI